MVSNVSAAVRIAAVLGVPDSDQRYATRGRRRRRARARGVDNDRGAPAQRRSAPRPARSPAGSPGRAPWRSSGTPRRSPASASAALLPPSDAVRRVAQCIRGMRCGRGRHSQHHEQRRCAVGAAQPRHRIRRPRHVHIVRRGTPIDSRRQQQRGRVDFERARVWAHQGRRRGDRRHHPPLGRGPCSRAPSPGWDHRGAGPASRWPGQQRQQLHRHGLRRRGRDEHRPGQRARTPAGSGRRTTSSRAWTARTSRARGGCGSRISSKRHAGTLVSWGTGVRSAVCDWVSPAGAGSGTGGPGPGEPGAPRRSPAARALVRCSAGRAAPGGRAGWTPDRPRGLRRRVPGHRQAQRVRQGRPQPGSHEATHEPAGFPRHWLGPAAFRGPAELPRQAHETCALGAARRGSRDRRPERRGERDR